MSRKITYVLTFENLFLQFLDGEMRSTSDRDSARETTTVECHIKCSSVCTDMAIFEYFWTSSTELLEQTESSLKNRLHTINYTLAMQLGCYLPLRRAFRHFGNLRSKCFDTEIVSSNSKSAEHLRKLR